MPSSFSFNYFGSTIDAVSLGTNNVPPTAEIVSAHCVALTTDSKIVAVNVTGRGIDIPGGHLDSGESAVEAMRREVYEEAYITVKEPILIDVWKLNSSSLPELSEKPYIVVYAALVDTVDTFQTNNEVHERLIISPSEFVSRYFGDKEQAQLLVDKALATMPQ